MLAALPIVAQLILNILGLTQATGSCCLWRLDVARVTLLLEQRAGWLLNVGAQLPPAPQSAAQLRGSTITGPVSASIKQLPVHPHHQALCARIVQCQ